MKENNYLTHGIHPYHAKFIPSIPNEFITKFTKKGDYILDPFCGSGTSLLEGILAERNCVGVDLSPIAYKISLAKTTIVDPNILKKHYEDIILNYDLIEKFDKRTFDNKYIWYTEETANIMDKLLFIISKIEDIKIRNIFEVIVSSIAKTVSNKRKTWNNGYIADNVLPNLEYTGNAYTVFQKKCIEQIKRYEELYFKLHAKNIVIDVNNLNILDFNSSKKFDLIVTSPPYPFAVDFTKYHRLSLYWFGYDVDTCAEKETGSRHKRNRKNAVEEFFEEMEIIYEHLFSLVKTGGYFCMTVADTHRSNEKISFIDWLYKLFNDNGWSLVSDELRNLECQSMGQKRIQIEHKLVFKKEV